MNQWSSVSLYIRSIFESWNQKFWSSILSLDYQNVKKKINFEELELPAYVNPCQPEEKLWRFYLRFMAILQYDLANNHISIYYQIRNFQKTVLSKMADFGSLCKSLLSLVKIAENFPKWATFGQSSAYFGPPSATFDHFVQKHLGLELNFCIEISIKGQSIKFYWTLWWQNYMREDMVSSSHLSH